MVQVLEGENAIAKNRELMGANRSRRRRRRHDPRGLRDSIDANAVHGSDGPDTAQAEIAYFFPTLDVHSR
jgi:nucleoside-diphosphate kinase